MDKEKVLNIIAENIKKIMNRMELTSTQIAKKCQVSNGTISKIIHGNMAITVPTLMALSQGLGVSIETILAGLTENIKSEKKTSINKKNLIHVGILSINHRRLTNIKNFKGDLLGRSDLAGDIDLAESPPGLLSIIKQSIHDALPDKSINNNTNFKKMTLTIVLQSYEFEDTREKFENLARKYFHAVKVLPDWKITYLAAFNKSPGLSLVTDKGVSLSYMQNGELRKLGGWKFPIYDLGGENWLGSMAVKHTIEAFENFVPMSNLATSILAAYGGKIETITEAYFKSQKDPDLFCRFADILIRSYFTGDVAAKNIIQEGFSLIYKLVDKADSILGVKHKIVINGSLKDIYKDFFANSSRLVASPNDEKKVALLSDLIRDESIGI